MVRRDISLPPQLLQLPQHLAGFSGLPGDSVRFPRLGEVERVGGVQLHGKLQVAEPLPLINCWKERNSRSALAADMACPLII